MDKTTFDAIMKFYSMECDAELVLEEKGLPIDEINEVLHPFTDYRERLLRVGKYTVEEELINKDTYIKEPYEDFKRYTRVTVLYEYENGMALCETNWGSLCLVPQGVLAEDDKIDNDKKDANTEHVLSYWSYEDDREHIVFCSTREEAEQKVRELDSLPISDVTIMTTKDYEELELDSIEIEDEIY